jgi:hypothetical protein
MTRSRLLGVLSVVAVIALGVYVARNTYWEDVPIPSPAKGEAATNPFYAAQRLVEELEGTTRRERSVVLPAGSGVLVLSAWHWDLTEERQTAITQWVESGGRLVVDNGLVGAMDPFAEWSGVSWGFNERLSEAHLEEHDEHTEHPECTGVEEVVPASDRSFEICGLDYSFLQTSRPPAWAVGDEAGLQAVRMDIGRGSVTVVNATPFTRLELFRGHHARFFVAATQLRRTDEVVFFTEDEHPSLLALMWMHGSPAVVLGLSAVALFLWRGAVRFGPPLAVPEPRRRSMAEQIRGSGRFVLKHGDGAPLHAAAVRALTEAARRKIPAYARLPRPQRAAALGRATGMDGDAIAAAIDAPGKRRPNELPNTLSLIEAARRQLLASGARGPADGHHAHHSK